jgi:hypothetical protein
MKKRYILYAVLPLMFSAIMGAAYVGADTTDTSNPMSDLVTAIAKKFNLNSSDVQQVFDEQKVRIESKIQVEFANRIIQAVSGGKLTQDQADKIMAKKTELEVQKTSLEGKSREERRSAIKAQMDSLKQWATDNNIPREYIPFIGGRGHGFFKGPAFGKPAGEKDSSASD